MQQPSHEKLLTSVAVHGVSETEAISRQQICETALEQISRGGHQSVFIEFDKQEPDIAHVYYDSCTHLPPEIKKLPVFKFMDHQGRCQHFILKHPDSQIAAESAKTGLQDRTHHHPLEYAWEMREVFHRLYDSQGRPRSRLHPSTQAEMRFTDLGPYRLLLLYSEIKDDNCLDIDDLVYLQTCPLKDSLPAIADIIELVCSYESYVSLEADLSHNHSTANKALSDFCKMSALGCRLDVKKVIDKLIARPNQ